jgi:hypothetical protein
MDEHVKKLRLLLKFALRVLSQLLSDLWAYYSSPYIICDHITVPPTHNLQGRIANKCEFGVHLKKNRLFPKHC